MMKFTGRVSGAVLCAVLVVMTGSVFAETYTTIKMRRDTAASWTAFNPVLAQGEPACEMTGVPLRCTAQKVGDGVTAWSALPYSSVASTAANTRLPANASDFSGADIGAKINAAVAAIGPTGGGTIIVPPTAGRVQTPIVINYPHITLQGAGKTATVLKASDTFTGTDVVLVSSASDVTVQDMEIDGNQSVLHATNLYGIHYLSSPNGRVSGCNIHNLVTAGVAFYSSSNGAAAFNDISDISGYVGSTGVVASNSTNVRVLHNNISRCNGAAARTAGASDDGNGIYFSGGADNGLAEGNTIRDCGRRGIKVQASDVKTAQNNMDDCAQSGIQLQNTTAIKGFASTADTIRMTNYGTYGVMMDQIIDNVKLVGITIDGPFYTGIDIRNGVTNLEVVSPTIKGADGWGIRIENLDGAAPASGKIKISGGSIESCGLTLSKATIEARPGLLPVDALVIDGVTITGNGANNAITVGDNQTNVTITNIAGGPVVPYGAVGLTKSTVLGGLTVSNFSTDPVINSNSGFTGNLLKFEVAGVQKAVMDYTGGLTINALYSPLVHTLGGDTSLDLQSNRNYTTGTTGVTLLSGGTISKTSGVFIGVDVKPVYDETSGAAANTDFRINRTQTALGSGTQRLFSAGVGGGTYVEKAGIDNEGNATFSGGLTAAGALAGAGGSANHAICWKADGKTLGYCSAVVAADGTCGTCN